MIVAFVLWSLCALLFVFFGCFAGKSKDPVGFFTFAKPPKVKKRLQQYNRAVGRLWMGFAFFFELLGIPLLFAEQNSLLFVIVTLGCFFLILGLIVCYLRIELKYRD